MKSISNYWHNHGIKFLSVSFVFLIVLVAIIRRMKGFQRKKISLTKAFKNLEEKYPQAFTAKPVNIKWTGDSKGEIHCRSFLENKYKVSFPKVRPQFLKNPITNGSLLELDCYNSALQLACEYHGEQHYKFVPHFHKSYDAFLNQKYRDQLKRDLCKRNYVHLIEVPFYVDIDSYLESETEKWQTHNLHQI